MRREGSVLVSSSADYIANAGVMDQYNGQFYTIVEKIGYPVTSYIRENDGVEKSSPSAGHLHRYTSRRRFYIIIAITILGRYPFPRAENAGTVSVASLFAYKPSFFFSFYLLAQFPPSRL